VFHWQKYQYPGFGSIYRRLAKLRGALRTLNWNAVTDVQIGRASIDLAETFLAGSVSRT
jgi:hypothetical protein